jgi:Protein of unknown function (DUF1571)
METLDKERVSMKAFFQAGRAAALVSFACVAASAIAPHASSEDAPAAAPTRQATPFRLAAERRSPKEYFRAPMAPEGQHPLAPCMQWAHEGIESVREIRDYTCTFVKRERIDGELREHEYMAMKLRHEPFSVYVKFLGPKKLKDNEAIYVEGKNNNMLVAHPGDWRKKIAPRLSLPPTGTLAMEGNRYPLTEAGILHLTERLIEIGDTDMKYGECDVQFKEGAKINGRICSLVEVTHPVPRKNFLFHKARIYVDDELNLPLRYEAYDWPKEPGGEPLLTEEYTYLNVKLNVGLTDADFDPDNVDYGYGR